MKTLDAAAEPATGQRVTVRPAWWSLRLAEAGALAAALSVVGVVSVLSTAFALWSLWSTDPLKSVGGLIVPVSFFLLLRVWRSLGWEMEGSWWGLALLAATVALVHLRDVAILELVLSPAWSVFLPPHQAVAVAYAAGAVLLFGGWRLLRAAWFPVALMWLVNPVPSFFTMHIDLPLQHLSSGVARAFAHAMGQTLTPDQLRLMFTPEFGMFIAPGCNGIRGAMTMAILALIAGYIYRFRVRTWALVVVGAVLLGYAFNLARLCTLVLYYIVALHIPWLQSRAEMGDYVIGACMFFIATILLFTAIQRLSPQGSLTPPPLPRQGDARQWAPRSFLPRWLAFVALVLLGSLGYARALSNQLLHPARAVDPNLLGAFPEHVGPYHLVDRWNDSLFVGGPVIFYFGDYVRDAAPASAAGGGVGAGGVGTGADPATISVGVSPILGAHDTLICHSSRGDEWLWHGELDMPTQSGPLSVSASLFNDGQRQYVEGDTVCQGEVCGQYSSSRKHFGLIYSRPDTHTLLSPNPERPIPLILRATSHDPTVAADLARTRLTEDLAEFMASVKLSDFTRPYRTP